MVVGLGRTAERYGSTSTEDEIAHLKVTTTSVESLRLELRRYSQPTDFDCHGTSSSREERDLRTGAMSVRTDVWRSRRERPGDASRAM